jgi:hypothetical protein
MPEVWIKSWAGLKTSDPAADTKKFPRRLPVFLISSGRFRLESGIHPGDRNCFAKA